MCGTVKPGFGTHPPVLLIASNINLIAIQNYKLGCVLYTKSDLQTLTLSVLMQPRLRLRRRQHVISGTGVTPNYTSLSTLLQMRPYVSTLGLPAREKYASSSSVIFSPRRRRRPKYPGKLITKCGEITEGGKVQPEPRAAATHTGGGGLNYGLDGGGKRGCYRGIRI